MRIKHRKRSKSSNNLNKSGNKSIVVTMNNEPESSSRSTRVLRVSSLKYVSPLGNIMPKTGKKIEEKIITKEVKGHDVSKKREIKLSNKEIEAHDSKKTEEKITNTEKEALDSSFEVVPTAVLSTTKTKSRRRRERSKKQLDPVPTNNNNHSAVEVIVISDPPNSDPVRSERVPSSTLALPAGTELLPYIDIERNDTINSEQAKNYTEDLGTSSTNLYDNCGLQKPVSSEPKARNELLHMQDKENVSLQRNAKGMAVTSQHGICILDENSASRPTGNNIDSESSGNNLQEQQAKCNGKGARRKREDDEVCDDRNSPSKKRKITSLGNDEDTANLSVMIINTESNQLVNNALSSCSSGDEMETIDLEPDTVTDIHNCSTLNNTIVLSDEEDSTSDDIIVLGTPIVPSVRSYKALSKNCGKSSKAETRSYKTPLLSSPPLLSNMNVHSNDISQNIIARAISKLSKTMDGSKSNMLGNVASNEPKLGGHTNNANLSSVAASSSATLPSPNSIYGSNIYNPCGKNVRTGLRPVIIDGSNVAMGHGNGQTFSAKGIDICVNYFAKKGHKVFAFIPKFRRGHHNTTDSHLLDKLHSEKLLIFTPSRYVDGQSDIPYDDRYIVQTAAELGGVIVSTDNYRDLMQENVQWHDTIKNRLLMFTWVEDLLIFPQDPLGRRGGGLEEFLRF